MLFNSPPTRNPLHSKTLNSNYTFRIGAKNTGAECVPSPRLEQKELAALRLTLPRKEFQRIAERRAVFRQPEDQTPRDALARIQEAVGRNTRR